MPNKMPATVKKMLQTSGVYLVHDVDNGTEAVPIYVDPELRAWSMKPDMLLANDRWHESVVVRGPLNPSSPLILTNYYVMRNSGGAVFVKEGNFFVEQGGLEQDWGKAWKRIEAESIEHARSLADKMLPGRRG